MGFYKLSLFLSTNNGIFTSPKLSRNWKKFPESSNFKKDTLISGMMTTILLLNISMILVIMIAIVIFITLVFLVTILVIVIAFHYCYRYYHSCCIETRIENKIWIRVSPDVSARRGASGGMPNEPAHRHPAHRLARPRDLVGHLRAHLSYLPATFRKFPESSKFPTKKLTFPEMSISSSKKHQESLNFQEQTSIFRFLCLVFFRFSSIFEFTIF